MSETEEGGGEFAGHGGAAGDVGGATDTAHAGPSYLAVWAGLAVLTLLEVWVATLGFGEATTIVVLVGLAIWKALLVALYYMHLRFEPTRLRILAVAPLPLAVILVLAVLMEY